MFYNRSFDSLFNDNFTVRTHDAINDRRTNPEVGQTIEEPHARGSALKIRQYSNRGVGR